MKHPWIKFFPCDWRADPRLRMCSLAARGLWAELIGYMHEAEPYGHLLVSGKRPGEADIAALVGRPLGEIRKALAELGERGVYSATEAGVIYSRRMIRDKAKEESDRENGKGGGNPTLKGGVNPPHNPRHKTPDKAHIPLPNPEANSSLRSERASARESGNSMNLKEESEARKAVNARMWRVLVDTPQWVAWQKYLTATKGKGSPYDKEGGWYFKSEWPPGHQPHPQE